MIRLSIRYATSATRYLPIESTTVESIVYLQSVASALRAWLACFLALRSYEYESGFIGPMTTRKSCGGLRKTFYEGSCGGILTLAEVLRSSARPAQDLHKTSARPPQEVLRSSLEVLRRSCGGLVEVLRRSCGAPQGSCGGVLRRSCGVFHRSCGGVLRSSAGVLRRSCGGLAEVLRSLLKPCGGLRKTLNFYITLS